VVRGQRAGSEDLRLTAALYFIQYFEEIPMKEIVSKNGSS
jgi:hypothetical protein